MPYATRNDAFVPAATWSLDGATLQYDDGKSLPRSILLASVKAIRLEFAPTRPERNRFCCVLTLRSGESLKFFNRSYRGPYEFTDTSTDYVAFVRNLHAALEQHAPDCLFVAGVTGARYALNWAATIFCGFMLLIVALFLVFNGLGWLILLKIALIAIFVPNVFRWLARNKPRTYPPGAIPPEILPAVKPA